MNPDNSTDSALATALDALQRKYEQLKREMESLKKEKEQFRSLVEISSDWTWEVDAQGCFTYSSPKVEDILGLSPKAVIGQPLFNLMPPEEADRIRGLFNEIATARRAFSGLENRNLHRDGRVVIIETNGIPIYNEEKVFTGYRGVNRDITERKRSENALRESEEKFRALAEMLPETIFEMDLEGRLTFVNRSAFKHFQYSQEIFEKGLSGFEMVVPEDRERAIRNVERILKGEIIGLQEYTAVRRNGDTFPIFIHAQAILKEGDVVGVRGVVIDISQQKKAEESLRDSEERLNAIVKATPDPLVVYDKEGYPEFINPAFTEAFGWSFEELKGRRIPFVPADQQKTTIQEIKKLYATGISVQFESKRLTKDNKLLDVLISAAIIKGARGEEPHGMVVNLSNITEIKRLEAQFHQAQKMEAIGTLTGGVAHDFNNLLMGIQGRVSLMMSETAPSHAHMEHLKGIEGYVKSAADLSKQLLGFAKGGKYEVKSTNLNDVIRNQDTMFGRTKKEIAIHEKLEASLWTTDVDRGQMEQVLLNLYVNAWQAMPKGGDLFIETDNCELDEEYVRPHNCKPGRYVKMSVTDTGIGMDRATQDRIFEPFFTTKEIGRGTGLGLASVYGIIKNHDGFIHVYSEAGVGTTFTIYLPASDKPVEKVKRFSSDVHRGQETLLLVDDEQMIVEVGQKLLEKLGYTVFTASNGEKAMGIIEAEKDAIQLVILDMIMPGMSGEEAYERIKAALPAVKVILSSGYSINGQAARILKKGCDGFIQKPFSMQVLSQKVREVLDAD